MPAKRNSKKARRLGWLAGTFVAAVLLAITFAVVELGLRVAGYGYDTAFFRKATIEGSQYWVENSKFGYRFFPPEIARVPSPVMFPVRKGSNTFRIFILGESAALGDPEPAFGVGRFLKALLEERFAGTNFEVIPAAMTAINSHALLPIARECAGLDGDLWILYMGNNEFVGPFGASTVFGAKAPPWVLARANLALKATRAGQLIDAVRMKAGRKATSKEWGSMKMFAEGAIAPDDPRRNRVYENFRKNVWDILGVAKEARVPVMASSVAVNLKDCAPFASMHPVGFPENYRLAWEKDYERAERAYAVGNFEEAIAGYTDAFGNDSTYADGLFRLGRCYLAVRNYRAAAKQFESARNHDALSFRADSTNNAIIENAALRGSALWIDAARELGDGMPGEELFYEHVHLNFEGNYQLAKLFANEMAVAMPEKLKAGSTTTNWMSFEQCARRLALTDWDRRRVFEEVLRRIGQAPFTSQSNHTNQVDSLRKKLVEVRARLNAAAFADAKTVYAEALKRNGGDFYLRGNYAKLLEDNRDLRGAIAQWEEVRKVMPHEPVAYYNNGKLLGQVGEYDRAMTNLARALEISPQLVEAMDEQGKVLLRAGKPDEALKVLEKLATMRPNNSRVRMGMAEALARLDRRTEAMRELERAIELQPTNWEARYLLGVELAAQDKIKEAREQFEAVVKLKPDYALGHLNFGVALAKERRLREAAREFQQTLEIEPTNSRARQFLEQLKGVN